MENWESFLDNLISQSKDRVIKREELVKLKALLIAVKTSRSKLKRYGYR